MALREACIVFESDVLFILAAKLRNDRESADFYEGIAKKIEKNCCVGGGGARRRIARGHAGDGGEGYQNVAGVGDRAIGQQTLNVGLNESSEISREHGESRENPESPEPVLSGGRNRGKNPQQQRKGSGLRSCGEQCRDRGGSAFIDIGCPDLERRNGDLEAESDEDKRQA